MNAGFAWIVAAKSQNQYGRLITRANIEPSTKFNTGLIFYPFSEILSVGSLVNLILECPTKIPAKTDLKMSAISSAAGVANCALRGWLE